MQPRQIKIVIGAFSWYYVFYVAANKKDEEGSLIATFFR
jgi:hypothetical protein